MQNKHKETFDAHRLRVLYVLSFFSAIATAFVAYTESSYLESFLPKESVGLVFTVGYIVTLIALEGFQRFVAWVGKRNATVLTLAAVVVAFFFLIDGYPVPVRLAAFVLYLVASMLSVVGFDILVEHFSKDGETGTIRGTQLTIVNAGWVIAPAASGVVLDLFGFEKVFTVALVFASIVLVGMLLFFPRIPHTAKEKKEPFLWTLRTMFSRRELSHPFILSFLLNVFYAWMVIYTPMYLVSLGISWTDIGKIFSVMLIPFVLFEYPAGIVADRYIGEKEILVFGFIVLSGATIALYFISGPILWLWALLLFVTRIGASLISVMADTYFFKQVDEQDIGLIDFFRNAGPLAYIVAPVVASILLFVMPMHALFLVLGVFVLLGVIFSLRLVDTK